MKVLIRYLAPLIILYLTLSCSGIPGQKESVSPKTKFKATVRKNSQPFINISTNDCEELGGYQIKSENAFVILGSDPETFSNISIFLYYKNLNDLYPGRQISVLNVNSGELLGFWANVLDNSTGQSYQTGIEGKVNGTLTIRSFDNATGLASFDVFFTGMLYQAGQLLANRTASFTGTFENVPIFPDEDAFTDCNAAKQGFGGGSGGTGGTGGNGGTGNTGGTGGNGGTGGTGGTGGSNTIITFANKTFLPISITFNGESKVIPYNSSVSFTGKANSNASGSASCANKTTSGEQIGLKMDWNLNYNFPASGTLTVNMNVSTSYFFLQLSNKSGRQINRLYVNYGLQNQTQDNIIIPADEKLYNIGYYKAFTNSNVRAENTSSNSYWSWATLSLPFTENQSKSLTANP
jgi:hypothetical protein